MAKTKKMEKKKLPVDKDTKPLASHTLLVRLQVGATSLEHDLASSVKAEHIVSVVTKFL